MTQEWIIYLLESAVILMFFWTVYWLFLKTDTFFRLNRIYLQVTLILGLLIPLFDWFIDIKTSDVINVYILDTIVVTAQKAEVGVIKIINHFQWIPIILSVGTIIAFILFIRGFIKIIGFVQQSKTVRDGHIIFVLNDRFVRPFSFLNYIFISQETFNGNNTQIINHEIIHVKQKHTLDLILSGFVGVLQWFNPFAWLYREAFREIHEYLADEAVLNQGEDPIRYKKSLFNEAVGFAPGVFSFFNVSFTKRRFKMMSRIKSPRSNALKVLVILPVVALMVVVFACGPNQDTEKEIKLNESISKTENSTINDANQNTEAKSGDDPVFTVVEQMPEYEGGREAMIADLVKGIVYPASAKQAGSQAKVFVEFIIGKDGQIQSPTVITTTAIDGGEVKLDQAVKEDLESAAIDAVLGLKKWKPGMQRGETVKVKMVIPIAFKLS